MSTTSGESWCVECSCIVPDDHALATKYHQVLHMSLFPSYRKLKQSADDDCKDLLCEEGVHYYCERPKLHQGPHDVPGLKAWY